ncbi:MAG: GntR family transcriptional regulator, partial [Solirubrobacteraceae bacterium]
MTRSIVPVAVAEVAWSKEDSSEPTVVGTAATGLELLLCLDRGGELPLHEQIERSLREDIRSGRLPGGTRLPSTRSLAAELGVSRGVVT